MSSAAWRNTSQPLLTVETSLRASVCSDCKKFSSDAFQDIEPVGWYEV
jgi:hypothetical protein